MKRGWFNDNWRHSLAARGIKTNHKYLKKATKRRPLSENQLERNKRVLQMSAALSIGQLPSGRLAETEADKRRKFAERSVARAEGIKGKSLKAGEIKAMFLQNAFDATLDAEKLEERGSLIYEDLSKGVESTDRLLRERRQKKLEKIESELESLRFEETMAPEKSRGKGEELESDDGKIRIELRSKKAVQREIDGKEEEAQRLREALGESDITAFGNIKFSWLKGVARTLGDVGSGNKSEQNKLAYEVVSKNILSPERTNNFLKSVDEVFQSLEPDEQREILLEFKDSFKNVDQEEVQEIGQQLKDKFGINWDEVQK